MKTAAEFIDWAIRIKRSRGGNWMVLSEHRRAPQHEFYDYTDGPVESRNFAYELPDVLERLTVTVMPARHPAPER